MTIEVSEKLSKRATKKTHQGASHLTARKEQEIGGIAQMRLTQLKGPASQHFNRIIVADIFSGNGGNVVDGDIIEGSPIKLLNALSGAITTKRGVNLAGLRNKHVHVVFSDIRKEASDKLRVHVDIHQEANPLPDELGVFIDIVTCDSATAVQEISDEMTKESLKGWRSHLILVLDPNGPRDFPRNETLELLARHSGRVDLIPYISATAVKRCMAHRDTCGARYDWWLAAIERFDRDFVWEIAKNRAGWIREPIVGDPQRWLMMPTFTPVLPTRNDWIKQGFVEILSPRGLAALDYYSGNGRELAA